MKKTAFLLLFVFAMSVLAAQTSPPDVPEPVKARFSKEYPNSIPTWGLDGNYYSATYYDQGNNLGRSVVYDKTGAVIRTESEMSAGSYPLVINDYYTQNYPDESYTIWSSKDSQGNLSYYSTRKGKKIWFDKDGRYSEGRTGKK